MDYTGASFYVFLGELFASKPFHPTQALHTRIHFAVAAAITDRAAVLATYKPPAGSCSHQQLSLTNKDENMPRTDGNETLRLRPN